MRNQNVYIYTKICLFKIFHIYIYKKKLTVQIQLWEWKTSSDLCLIQALTPRFII